VIDGIFLAALMRWGMLLIVVIGVLWGMYELFRRFSLIDSFSTYGPGDRLSSESES
jgi:ABC-type dipeptide/oligopeptide/nickel transport system permease component